MDSVKGKGYTVQETSSADDHEEYTYMLHLSQTSKVALNDVEDFTHYLYDLASRHDGFYDRWETVPTGKSDKEED